MTLEDVFVCKLKDDPKHVLEVARDFLERGLGNEGYVRDLIDRLVLSWLEECEDHEELGRSVLGLELMNMLRPV